MDIVNFFKRQTDLWNEDNKCGFCWSFGAPLTESGVNETVIDKNCNDCCLVNLFITNLSERKNRNYNNTTKLLIDYTIDYTFTLHVLALDRTDTNVYNEQIGYPVCESKWSNILRPLQKCVCEEEVLKLCEILDKKILITNWNAITRINWLDNNYTGWSITMTFRDYDCTDNSDDSDCTDCD